MNLIEQEVSTQRWIDIPEEVLQALHDLAPEPARAAPGRSKRRSKTPARIYYKYEGVSPPGSHKPNTAIPQAYYNKVFGIKRLTTETGAGQWGSALAFACAQFGLECKVYMVRISFDQKPFRKTHDADLGGRVRAQPQQRDQGRPRHPGAAPRHPRQPRASPSARPSRRPSATPPARRATRSAACSTT